MIISVNGGPAREVALNGLISIGRAADNTVTLDDPSVARYHAVIERRGAAYFLSDLGSVNGTQVNGQPVAGERQVKAGDVIALGGATVIKLAGAETDKPSAAATSSVATTASPEASVALVEQVAPSGPAQPNSSATPETSSPADTGLSAGMVGAAVAVGLILTVFFGLAAYLIYQRMHKTELVSSTGTGRTPAAEASTVTRTVAGPTPTMSTEPGAFDVRLAAQSLATQLTGNPLDYYSFEAEFLNKIAERLGDYRGFSLADARRYQREISLAFQNAGVNKKYGFILALSESRFGTAESGGGVGLWQLPPSGIKDYLRPNEDIAALSEPKRAAEVAAAYLKDRFGVFDDADFMYVIASYRLTMRQAGELSRQLATASAADRRNFWKMVNSGVVPREAAEQVVRFFAAGIIGENPQVFGFPPGRLSDL